MPECWGLLVRCLLALLVWPWQRPQEARATSIHSAPDATCPYTTNQSYLNSFIWTIKKEPPSYFFGTIHVPYTKVWDFIPENTKEAFERADNVFFELDLTDPDTISTLANCQLLPAGELLSNLLPRDLYRRLKRHLDYVKLMMPVWMTADQRGRGLYADYLFNAITGNWERKRPVWVMLMVNSLTEGDIKSRGIPVLDLYLAQEAERMNKQTGAVERVEEQCVPLNELNFSQVVFALNQTLMQHENYRLGEGTMPYTTNDLITHYNCGDLNTVIYNHDTAQVPNLVNNSLPPGDLMIAQHIDDYFRQELIYKRNLRMAERVDELLKTQPDRSFFFAFGAGHFLGNNSVLDRLREMGYEVEHTMPDSDVYLGANYKKKKRKHIFSARPINYPVSPVIINGQGEYLDPFYDRRRHRTRHRHQRQRKKGRRRERYPTVTDSYRLKQPQFNDLWVRLEATSFGPDAFFRKHGVTTSPPEPTPVPTAYSSCESRSRVSYLSVITIITFTVICSLCSSHVELLKVSR